VAEIDRGLAHRLQPAFGGRDRLHLLVVGVDEEMAVRAGAEDPHAEIDRAVADPALAGLRRTAPVGIALPDAGPLEHGAVEAQIV
jgi:hypothetical protein